MSPCPFCGEAGLLTEFEMNNGNMNYMVECYSCMVKVEKLFPTKERALDYWNRRKEESAWIHIDGDWEKPDDGQVCLVFDGDEINTATWQDDRWFCSPDFLADEVTHWMPIPSQPITEAQA